MADIQTVNDRLTQCMEEFLTEHTGRKGLASQPQVTELINAILLDCDQKGFVTEEVRNRIGSAFGLMPTTVKALVEKIWREYNNIPVST